MTKTYIFDIDGTIADCIDTVHIYDSTNIFPDENMVKIINYLYDKGNEIWIVTGRGGTTGIDWRSETEKQLKDWGVKYHKLEFIKKPLEYVYIDDKACSPEEFLNKVEL